jgi:hypothetical protein
MRREEGLRMKRAWIVMDGAHPVRYMKSFGTYTRGCSAEVFRRYGQAQNVRLTIQRRYWQIANRAPSADSKQFQDFKARAEAVRIVSIEVAE